MPVAELEEQHGPFGVTFELTGPWPPYNFVPALSTALAAGSWALMGSARVGVGCEGVPGRLNDGRARPL